MSAADRSAAPGAPLERGGHHRRRHRSTPRWPRTGLGLRTRPSASASRAPGRARAARARVRV